MNNYPAGADTPNAPWNEVDKDPIDVECTYIETLSKKVDVYTYDYIMSPPEQETDEDGYIITYPPTLEEVNVCMTDYNAEHYTISELLEEAEYAFDTLSKQYLAESEMENISVEERSKYIILSRKYAYYAEQAKGWEVDDQQLIKEN